MQGWWVKRGLGDLLMSLLCPDPACAPSQTQSFHLTINYSWECMILSYGESDRGQPPGAQSRVEKGREWIYRQTEGIQGTPKPCPPQGQRPGGTAELVLSR